MGHALTSSLAVRTLIGEKTLLCSSPKRKVCGKKSKQLLKLSRLSTGACLAQANTRLSY
jgi:hypothetical protein